MEFDLWKRLLHGVVAEYTTLNGVRATDGRELNQHRPYHITRSVINNTLSCSVRLGQTRILCSFHNPKILFIYIRSSIRFYFNFELLFNYLNSNKRLKWNNYLSLSINWLVKNSGALSASSLKRFVQPPIHLTELYFRN